VQNSGAEMSRLLVIGVDALDAVQFEKFRAFLPNLSRLRAEGFYSPMSSVWPPDSDTAWASIFTGWNPARHGVFRFMDPLEKTSRYIQEERDNSILRGNTFWDIAGIHGKRILALFPHACYPSWPVNGLMITRASLGTHVSIAPEEYTSRYDLNGLNAVKGLAGRDRAAYLRANRRQVERQLELTRELVRAHEWDLCFTYWPALDIIQHQFWNSCDPNDPTYPGANPYQDAIRDFYIMHDRVVGELANCAGKDTNVMVLSDHGHGRRPVRIFNINKLLLNHGLLYLKHPGTHAQRSLLRKVKAGAMSLAGKYHLGAFAAKALKAFPGIKKAYITAADLDLERSLAYTTDMSGIKAYSYGGVLIARRNINGLDYESVRDNVIGLLEEAVDPQQPGRPLVKWIKRREELYAGPYLGEYPDLVFELQPDLGAGWDAAGGLFDVSLSHNLHPGSHYGASATFFLSGVEVRRDAVRLPSSLMDIAPTILDILGLPAPADMEGRSVLNQ